MRKAMRGLVLATFAMTGCLDGSAAAGGAGGMLVVEKDGVSLSIDRASGVVIHSELGYGQVETTYPPAGGFSAEPTDAIEAALASTEASWALGALDEASLRAIGERWLSVDASVPAAEEDEKRMRCSVDVDDSYICVTCVRQFTTSITCYPR